MSLSFNGSQKKICHHSLKNEEFLYKLKHDFHDIFMSIYGPHGSTILIKNSGGEDFFTSSSHLVLQQVQFNHPVSKLINAVISAQNKAYGNHGSYIGILCSGLLYRCLKLDCSSRHIIEISTCIVQKIEDYLVENSCRITKKIDYSKASNVLGIIRGILDSKSSHSLSERERSYFRCKVAECFVKSLPSFSNYEEFSPFHISTIEGPDTNQTLVKTGLFYREDDKSLSEIQSLIKRKCSSRNKVALFNVPLAYVKESSFNASCSVNSFSEFIASTLIRRLDEIGVSIIASQKYIDEIVKYELEKVGFVVLERLGTSLMASLVKMSGGTPLSGFSAETPMDDNILGFIGQVESLEMFDRNYFQLSPFSNSSCTSLIITGINCHVTSYLESAARTCIDLLQLMVLKDDRVIIGGGCLEAFIISLLMQMKSENFLSLSQEFDTSPLTVNQILHAFIQTFVSLAVKLGDRTPNDFLNFFIDSSYGHLWHRLNDNKNVPLRGDLGSNCVCKSIPITSIDEDVNFTSIMSLRHEGPEQVLTGKTLQLKDVFACNSKMKESSWSVNSECQLDYFPAKLNAIRMALETFSELIGVGESYYNT